MEFNLNLILKLSFSFNCCFFDMWCIYWIIIPPYIDLWCLLYVELTYIIFCMIECFIYLSSFGAITLFNCYWSFIVCSIFGRDSSVSLTLVFRIVGVGLALYTSKISKNFYFLIDQIILAYKYQRCIFYNFKKDMQQM